MMAVESALDQCRTMIAETIAANAQCLQVQRYPLIDNGSGKMVPNPAGTPTTVEIRGRIATLAYGYRGVQVQEQTTVGISVPDTQFLLVEYDEDLREHDTFDYNGHTWRAGPIELIYRFGGVAGKEAPVKKGNAA